MSEGVHVHIYMYKHLMIWKNMQIMDLLFYYTIFMADDHQSSDTIDDIYICIEFLLGNALRSGNPQ